MRKVKIVKFVINEWESSKWLRRYILAPIVAEAKIKYGNKEVEKNFRFIWEGNEDIEEHEESYLTVFLINDISKWISMRFNEVLLEKGIKEKYWIIFVTSLMMTGKDFSTIIPAEIRR